MYIWANSGVFGSFTPCAITPIFRPRKRMASHSIRFISRRHSLRNHSLRFISRRHSLPNHSLRHSLRQSFARQSLPVSMGTFKPWCLRVHRGIMNKQSGDECQCPAASAPRASSRDLSRAPVLRGLHSSSCRLNLSAFCGIGGACRGCSGGV